MNTSTLTVRFSSPLLRITDVVCRHPRGGCGCERGGERTHLALLRRRGFGYHVNGRSVIGDPATALLYRAGDTYRISHPFEGGDRCSVFETAPEHEEEVFGRRLGGSLEGDLRRGVSGRNQWAHRQLHAALQSGAGDSLATEEAAVRLCQSVLGGQGAETTTTSLSPSACRAVQRAREALLAEPSCSMGLDALGRIAGCSPFHLARIFRREAGLTLAGYRTQLRIALALERLMQGAGDLSALAQDLGFSHHSHFSATFRRHVGVTPSVARDSLRRPELRQLGRNLTARSNSAR